MNVVTQFPPSHDLGSDPPFLAFRAMFEAAAIGIAICRLDGRILEANPALAAMLGYGLKELLGTDACQLYAELPSTNSDEDWNEDWKKEGRKEHRKEDRKNTREYAHKEILESAHTCFPNNGDGLSDAYPLHNRLLSELVGGDRASFEVDKHYLRKDGSKLWGHLTVSLVQGVRRQPSLLIAMLADATERKHVEEHLREVEKMEVIGRLAGGIAHDFNNLLTGILLYCDLLTAGFQNVSSESSRKENGQDESSRRENGQQWLRELSQHVDEVRRAGEQGAAMTQQLLAIARKQAAEPRAIPINQTVAATENLLRRLVGEQNDLILALDPSLDANRGLVLGDPAQLHQVLLNLVLNARDAMPNGGKITVSTRLAEFFDQSANENGRKAISGSTRPAIVLTVADSGCGMNEETRAHLFEPFFTTKKPGEGTGLGLATVQRIVSQSRGRITVKSNPGHGTSIEVFFPMTLTVPMIITAIMPMKTATTTTATTTTTTAMLAPSTDTTTIAEIGQPTESAIKPSRCGIDKLVTPAREPHS